jgi:hypothetical protein
VQPLITLKTEDTSVKFNILIMWNIALRLVSDVLCNDEGGSRRCGASCLFINASACRGAIMQEIIQSGVFTGERLGTKDLFKIRYALAASSK